MNQDSSGARHEFPDNHRMLGANADAGQQNGVGSHSGDPMRPRTKDVAAIVRWDRRRLIATNVPSEFDSIRRIGQRCRRIGRIIDATAWRTISSCVMLMWLLRSGDHLDAGVSAGQRRLLPLEAAIGFFVDGRPVTAKPPIGLGMDVPSHNF